MKKWIKRILIFLLVSLVVIQFIRPAKNTSYRKSVADITTRYLIPDSVDKIFKVACYDCHSNNTRYPWYAKIQPVYFWLDSHVDDGKQSLNFSEFTSYRIYRQYGKFKQIGEEVKDGEMPLSSYTFIHTDAKLSEGQKQLIYAWTNAMRDSIKLKYPADSLKKPLKTG